AERRLVTSVTFNLVGSAIRQRLPQRIDSSISGGKLPGIVSWRFNGDWRSGSASRTATPTPSPLKWRAEPICAGSAPWAMIGGRAYCRLCSQVTFHLVRREFSLRGNQVRGQSRGLEWRDGAD